MLSGVQVICFAASYAVTLALELTRLLFRSKVRGVLMWGFAAAGLLAHTVFLFHRGLEFYRHRPSGGSLLSSEMDWYLVAAWVLVVFYLYVMCYHPRTSFGLFVLPLVLGLIGVASFVADRRPFPREAGSRLWAIVHGTAILLGTVAVLVGFASGLMYLRQSRRLKSKLLPGNGPRLPSLEWLQKTNSRTLTLALLMVGLGILSGIILNASSRAGERGELAWSDPVVLSTLGMFGWLLISTSVGIVYRPAREGRRVAYFTLVSFVFLVIVLAMVLSGLTQHGGVRLPQHSRGGDWAPAGAAGTDGQEAPLAASGRGGDP
ncbi:MAG: cytochrome c biogenesis protein CcsA [Thermoguttaceae bacterium]